MNGITFLKMGNYPYKTFRLIGLAIKVGVIAALMVIKEKWTSPTLGTGSIWVWLLRSRPDQVTKLPCEEARPHLF